MLILPYLATLPRLVTLPREAITPSQLPYTVPMHNSINQRHLTNSKSTLILLLGVVMLSNFQASSCGQKPASAEIITSEKGEQEAIDCSFVSKLDQSVQHYVMINFGSEKPADPPWDSKVAQDCLIALHGHGSDRWQFINQTRNEVQATKDFAKRHRMLYISPDYRAPISWMGPAAEADLLQIIEEIQSNYKPNRIYLCGGSMGGTSALTFAALHPALISGVASMNGTANHLEYENFQDAISASFGSSKRDKPEEYKKRSAEYFPEKLTMPIGMTVDVGDEIVPPDSCVRLANILKKLNRPVKLIESPDSGHDTNYKDATAILEYIIQDHTVTSTVTKE